MSAWLRTQPDLAIIDTFLFWVVLFGRPPTPAADYLPGYRPGRLIAVAHYLFSSLQFSLVENFHVLLILLAIKLTF